jgi:hypothetical protein
VLTLNNEGCPSGINGTCRPRDSADVVLVALGHLHRPNIAPPPDVRMKSRAHLESRHIGVKVAVSRRRRTWHHGSPTAGEERTLGVGMSSLSGAIYEGSGPVKGAVELISSRWFSHSTAWGRRTRVVVDEGDRPSIRALWPMVVVRRSGSMKSSAVREARP